MNDTIKNIPDIIKAASADPFSLIVFIILVFASLFYFYLKQAKKNGEAAVLFVILLVFTILLILICRPRCSDGSYSSPCPPPIVCWDGSRSNPCPKKPWVSTSGIGKDSSNKKADFNIYVLTSEYHWEIGTPNNSSGNEKEGLIRDGNGKLKNSDFLKEILRSPDISRVLTSADTIISFGTASCQGIEGEEKRALDRANLIQSVIKQINIGRKISPKYKRLNLGQFTGGKCGDAASTGYQRSIVVVGADIVKGNEDVNISEALKFFLQEVEKKESDFGFKISDYSRFDYTN